MSKRVPLSDVIAGRATAEDYVASLKADVDARLEPEFALLKSGEQRLGLTHDEVGLCIDAVASQVRDQSWTPFRPLLHKLQAFHRRGAS